MTDRTEGIDYLESLSKITAILFLIVYVCGFLVVSLYNSSFGFSDMNPFRPKILTAGILFLFFTLLPILPAQKIFRHGEKLSSEQSFARIILELIAFLITCSVTSVCLSAIYVPSLDKSLNLHKDSWSDTAIISFCVLFILFILALFFRTAWSNYKDHPKIVSFIVGIALVGLITASFLQAKQNVLYAIELWFFAVGVGSVLITNFLIKPEIKSDLEGQRAILWIILLALTVFPVHIYPRIKSSWGGGSPISVTIYFEKDSLILPSQQLSAKMIDESDNGFFLIQDGKSEALFLPRSDVAVISFSQEPLDPKLFNRQKQR
jgi:hypothetical protein